MNAMLRIFSIISLCVVTGSTQSITPHHRDSSFFLDASMLCYVRNTEFSNQYREGQTYLGSLGQIRLRIVPLDAVNLSCGVHVRKDFGDEDFFSDARPLFQALYHKNAFSLVLGQLERTSQRHGLPDALLSEEFVLNPGIEEGLQMLWDGRMVNQDFWISYSKRNTPEHREHITAGNCTSLGFGFMKVSAMLLADHYGGQQFAPEGDPVRENVTAAVGVATRFPFEGVVNGAGAEQLILGSYSSHDQTNARKNGWGALSSVWLSIAGFQCRIGFFQGSNYVAWLGNALYQANSPYYNLQVSRKILLSPHVFLDFGGRLEFVEIDPTEYGKRGENVVWVTIGGSMANPIRTSAFFGNHLFY